MTGFKYLLVHQKQIKIWFKHQCAIQQQSKLWFTHTLKVNLNSTDPPYGKWKEFEFFSCCVFWIYQLREQPLSENKRISIEIQNCIQKPPYLIQGIM